MGVFFLLSLLAVLLIVVLHVQHQRTSERWMQRTFDALAFDTAQGRRYGPDVRVVKRVVHEFSGHHRPLTAFWYCVGEGPSYFVAMAQFVHRGWRGGHYEWTVRAVDETQMRGALLDDEDALQATFGEAHAGTLHA